MVALKTERQVFMWHLTPHSNPKDAPVGVALSDIVQILETSWQKNEARIYISADSKIVDPIAAVKSGIKNCIYIADMKRDAKKGTVTLLINRGDPDATDPAYLGVVSRTVRTVGPEEDDEILGWSAHLVVSLNEIGQGRYRACFERMPNVPSTLAEKLFQDVLDRHTSTTPGYTYKKSVKQGNRTRIEDKPYKMRLGVQRVPSEKILHDLDEGELSEIHLIKEDAQYQGPAAPDVIKSTTNVLKIRPKDVDKGRIREYVRDLTKWAAKDNKFTAIQFKVVNLPGNKSASPRFAMEQNDAMETLYARSQRLTGFGQLLQQCYEVVCVEIEKKINNLLLDDDRW